MEKKKITSWLQENTVFYLNESQKSIGIMSDI